MCSIQLRLFNELVLQFLWRRQRVTANPVPMSWAELRTLQGVKA